LTETLAPWHGRGGGKPDAARGSCRLLSPIEQQQQQQQDADRTASIREGDPERNIYYLDKALIALHDSILTDKKEIAGLRPLLERAARLANAALASSFVSTSTSTTSGSAA
jgi:hypothetical protein